MGFPTHLVRKIYPQMEPTFVHLMHVSVYAYDLYSLHYRRKTVIEPKNVDLRFRQILRIDAWSYLISFNLSAAYLFMLTATYLLCSLEEITILCDLVFKVLRQLDLP